MPIIISKNYSKICLTNMIKFLINFNSFIYLGLRMLNCLNAGLYYLAKV